jgi:hypothetical protein
MLSARRGPLVPVPFFLRYLIRGRVAPTRCRASDTFGPMVLL